MTKEEKIAKIGEILDKYCKWVNHLIKEHLIYDHAGLVHTMTFPSLALWLDYNYKAESEEIGKEIIFNNLKRCCSIVGPDDDISAWTD